jgi:hypothetical protein
MTSDQLAGLTSNDVPRGRLAKLMALECFRNTMLEDFHEGKVPSSRTATTPTSRSSRRTAKFLGMTLDV